mgnify:CR=1 FL=1
MAFNLFGFTFGKKEPDKIESFVPRNLEDGASVVESGGFQGMYIDLDGTLKADVDLIRKYREMSLNAEVDMAIDDVVNEAITEDAKGFIVQLDLDKLPDLPEEVKQIMYNEFQSIINLLDFNRIFICFGFIFIFLLSTFFRRTSSTIYGISNSNH